MGQRGEVQQKRAIRLLNELRRLKEAGSFCPDFVTVAADGRPDDGVEGIRFFWSR